MHGIRLQANPNIQQKKTLSQWMGCARLIWNAKCEDELYMTRYARRYCPIGQQFPAKLRPLQIKGYTGFKKIFFANSQ